MRQRVSFRLGFAGLAPTLILIAGVPVVGGIVVPTIVLAELHDQRLAGAIMLGEGLLAGMVAAVA